MELTIGTLIEFESGMQCEIIKVFSQNLVDLRAIKSPIKWLPDYLPVYYSIELENFKILNEHQSEAPKVGKHKESGNLCVCALPHADSDNELCIICGRLLDLGD